MEDIYSGMRSEKRPNILLLVMDTLRKDRVSCYSEEERLTPVLDGFAKDATVFEEAVANSPWTLPSHASIFTGRYPSEHGATQLTPFLEEKYPTLPKILREEGYSTACFTCNSWITPSTGLSQGFETYRNFFNSFLGFKFLTGIWKKLMNSRFRRIGDRLISFGNSIYESMTKENNQRWTPGVIDSSIDFVKDSEEPYFLFINLMDPHLPYVPPERMWKDFMNGVTPEDLCQNSKKFNSRSVDVSEDEIRLLNKLYNAEVSYMDSQISRLLDYGNDENTLVIATSDHGENIGEHGLIGHEFCVYDTLLEVPLIVDWPEGHGIQAKGRVDEQIELRQLFHTILDLTGTMGLKFDRNLSLAGEVESRLAISEYFLPKIELELMRRINPEFRDPSIEADMKSLRTEKWKYIWHEKVKDKLFNLEEDPGEKENLIEEYPREAQKLSELLQKRVKSPGFAPKNAEEVLNDMDALVKKRLEKLGYL